jgi:hypothetical protein
VCVYVLWWRANRPFLGFQSGELHQREIFALLARQWKSLHLFQCLGSYSERFLVAFSLALDFRAPFRCRQAFALHLRPCLPTLQGSGSIRLQDPINPLQMQLLSSETHNNTQNQQDRFLSEKKFAIANLDSTLIRRIYFEVMTHRAVQTQETTSLAIVHGCTELVAKCLCLRTNK